MKTLKNICTEYSTPTLTVSIGIFIYVQNQYTKDRKRRKIVENFKILKLPTSRRHYCDRPFLALIALQIFEHVITAT